MTNHRSQIGSRSTSSAFGPAGQVARRVGVGLLALSSVGVVYAGMSHASGPVDNQVRTTAGAGSPLKVAEGQAPITDEAQKRKAYDRFFAEGYDLAYAEKLAGVWQIDPQDAKIKGGQKLLDAGPGSTLITDGDNVGDVIKDDGSRSSRSSQSDSAGDGQVSTSESSRSSQSSHSESKDGQVSTSESSQSDSSTSESSDDGWGASDDEAQKRAAYDRFFAEGYDLADAEKLAGIWQIDPQDAKIKAGQKLLSGVTPPVSP
jgi:hypothetical protein